MEAQRHNPCPRPAPVQNSGPAHEAGAAVVTVASLVQLSKPRMPESAEQPESKPGAGGQ